MAELTYNAAALAFMRGDIDMNAPDDFRILLLTTDAENPDHATVAAIIAAGAVEATHTNYARHSVAGDATAQDDTNDRAEYDATDPVFSSIGAGADIVAAVLYQHNGADSANIPIAHYDTNFPVTPNGSDITLTINAEGLLQIAAG